MAKLLKIKDSVQEWVDKVNKVINLNNVDGSFSIKEEQFENTQVDISEGTIRVGYKTKTIPGKTFDMPKSNVLIVGIDFGQMDLVYYQENSIPEQLDIPLYRIKTNNYRIIDVKDLRTWVYKTSNQESSVSPSSVQGGSGSNVEVDEGFSDTIVVDSPESYSNGDDLWILGAVENEPVELYKTDLSLSVSQQDFSSGDFEFSYKVAHFSMKDGKYSPATDNQTIKVNSDEIEEFSLNKYIRLSLNRPNIDSGLLIYRRVGSEYSHKLLAILGPNELGTQTTNISYVDYWKWGEAPWSNRDNKGYLLNVDLFPIEAPKVAGGGWTKAEVELVDTVQSTIKLKEEKWFRSTVWVYPDHTKKLQALINKNGYVGIPRGETWVSSLTIPKGTTISGHGWDSKIVRLPWCGGTLNMLKGDPDDDGVMEFEAHKINFQGNASNQWLPNITTESQNAAIRLWGKGIRMVNCKLENLRGTGLWFNDNDGGGLVEEVELHNNWVSDGGLDLRENTYPVHCNGATDVHVSNNTFANFTETVNFSGVRNAIISPNIIRDCSSGILVFGSVNTVASPNVIVGPAGEHIPSSDRLNSEFDSVNIFISPNEDYTSPKVVYEEGGETFDLVANNGKLSSAINELTLVDGKEVIGEDYTAPSSGQGDYIIIDGSVNQEEGEVYWRIPSDRVNDIISRASLPVLRETNPDSQGLIYRILHTEYPPIGNISNGQYDETNQLYTLTVNNDRQQTGLPGVSSLGIGDKIQLVNHSTTPDLTGESGTVVNINTISNKVTVDFGKEIFVSGNEGQITLKNTFTIVKGKIN